MNNAIVIVIMVLILITTSTPSSQAPTPSAPSIPSRDLSNIFIVEPDDDEERWERKAESKGGAALMFPARAVRGSLPPTPSTRFFPGMLNYTCIRIHMHRIQHFIFLQIFCFVFFFVFTYAVIYM